MKNSFSLLLICVFANLSFAQNYPKILSERDRADVINTTLADRFDNLLPQLMRREGIDMWILISREYNEDPVMRTMLPAEWLSARRRTIMVFSLKKRLNTEGSEKDIIITAKRIDPAPGTHTVTYDSPIDTIEITHTAHSREGFATGAVLAAEWLYGKKGVFSMKDMLGF